MKPSLLLPVLLALALAPGAQGHATPATGAPMVATVHLRYLYLPSIPTFFPSAKALDQLTLDFGHNRVIARGSKDAIVAFTREIHAADVLPTQYKIAARLVHSQVDAQGKSVETVTDFPMVTDPDNVSATFSVRTLQGIYRLLVTPQKGPNEEVAVSAEVQAMGEQGEVLRSGKNTQRVPLGKTVRITGVTETSDDVLHRAVGQGQVVTDHGAYTSDYAEVTLTDASQANETH